MNGLLCVLLLRCVVSIASVDLPLLLVGDISKSTANKGWENNNKNNNRNVEGERNGGE